PLVEELVFRGFLLGGLSRHVGFATANVVQASVFAAFHADPPRLPFYFTLGLLAGWLVRRSGGLAPALALHALNNALFVTLRQLL
ncbi:MAG TPA: CPBP family intramembrane glutamic endopeptidase, partial [Tahibacter sp.]|nr:CPBP family intramembrane glutamic endopeptidase [Tahibacter sp.]